MEFLPNPESEVPVFWDGRWWTSKQWEMYKNRVKTNGLDKIVNDKDISWLQERNAKNPPKLTIMGKVIE